MIEIRPYQLFRLFDAAANSRDVGVQLPFRRGYGSLTMLETMILLAAVKAVDAKTVFEFGTFLGSTTLNLAMNVADGGQVFTLDLPDDSQITQHAEDAAITNIRRTAENLDFHGSRVADQVTELRGDSVSCDYSPWIEAVDLVFIDGGHDLATVSSDTQSAFKMVRPGGRSAILWHDYSNPDYPELSVYLDDLAQHRPMFHVGDTMICAWFDNALSDILSLN